MTVDLYTLDAFTDTPGGGNPAGVVLEADNLGNADMQKIAAKAGFSETAFVKSSETADVKTRFFTPNSEVNLCGHATIATFSLLAQMKIISAKSYIQETNAGLLPVEVSSDNSVFMRQNTPQFLGRVEKKEISDSLNLQESCIDGNYPIQVVSTGLCDIMVPVRSLKQLMGIKPNFKKISDVCKEYGAAGCHVFSLETLHSSTAHCRNFAPLYGIPEESATGTSNGALACYLYKYGIAEGKSKLDMVFEQGYSMHRPSEISARLTVNGKEILKVEVGGKACNINKTKIDV